MELKDIYQHFDNIGSVVFATIDNGYPETRIAHFFAYDKNGLYFRTMDTKPFYHQLKTNSKLSVCGLKTDTTEIKHDDAGLPIFEPGYSIRVTGDIKEISYDYIEKQSENNTDFLMGLKDIQKYPAIKVFAMYRGRGEIFDYDFEKQNRDHKLKREKFTFNSFSYPQRGLAINDNCINCSLCFKSCSFDAISKGQNNYEINQERCDMCGDCTIVCKFDAIEVHIE